MVGGITLARMTSDGELPQEILKVVAHPVSKSVSALSDIDAEFFSVLRPKGFRADMQTIEPADQRLQEYRRLGSTAILTSSSY